MSEPSVSVLMLSYNRPELLDIAIRSVVGQTFADWELVIVDDGSSDSRVREVLDGWSKTDPRIRTMFEPTNLNRLSVTFNKAASLATAQFLTWLDDDDRKRSEFLQQMFGNIGESLAIGCFGVTIDYDGKQIGDAKLPGELTVQHLLDGNFCRLGQLLVRADVFRELGGLDETIRCSEDWDFCLRLISRFGPLRVLQDQLMEIREVGPRRGNIAIALDIIRTNRYIQNRINKEMETCPTCQTRFDVDLGSDQVVCRARGDVKQGELWGEWMFCNRSCFDRWVADKNIAGMSLYERPLE